MHYHHLSESEKERTDLSAWSAVLPTQRINSLWSQHIVFDKKTSTDNQYPFSPLHTKQARMQKEWGEAALSPGRQINL